MKITMKELDAVKQSLIEDNHAEDGEGRYGPPAYDQGVCDAVEEIKATIRLRTKG